MSLIHIGRRKCAVALVHFIKGDGSFVINGKTGFSYLQEDPFAIQTVIAPLKSISLEKKYNIICSVRGGGKTAQAEAIQLGVARALCSLDKPLSSSNSDKSKTNIENAETSNKRIRPVLKEQGFLRRDSRIKERRKYGLKKARKAEQYSKR